MRLDRTNPTRTADPLEPASPELVAALTSILDGANGDEAKAAEVALNKLVTDIHGQCIDPEFGALFNGWSYARAFPYLAVQHGMLTNLFLRIRSQRQRDKVA
jgi:hypothetical protein